MKNEVNVMQVTLCLCFTAFGGPELAALASNIITAMTGNPYFDAKLQLFNNLQDLLTAYNTAASAAAKRDSDAVATKKVARMNLIGGMQALGLYCMSVANNDRQILQSTGFPVSKRGSGSATPSIKSPSNLRVTDGPVPFSIQVSVDGDPQVKTFNFQYTPDPLTTDSIWTSEMDTQATHIFYNLEEKRYWFRVLAVGVRQQLKYSGVTSRIVQ